MNIIKIQGGLGNQMFIYAFAKALSLISKQEVKLDISEYKTYFRPFELEIFNISKNYAEHKELPRYEQLHSNNRYIAYVLFKIKQVCRLINPYNYTEKNMQYDPKFLEIQKGYIDGYFQSELYFKNIEKEIRKIFSFVTLPNSKNQKIIDQIQKQQAISVHIRRGDYLQGNNISYHGICSVDYYKKAIDHIKSHVKDPIFYFFSDDIERVQKNLSSGLGNDHYINHNIGSDSREDMRLMSNCKHNIVANSSFSRWGAWLNNNPEKIVIAPKQWFENQKLDTSNVIPKHWTRI